MDDNKKITLTLSQLVKVMSLHPAQRIRFWIYMKRDMPMEQILEKLGTSKFHDPK